MKRSKFTEAQIIAILRVEEEQGMVRGTIPPTRGGGREDRRDLSQARDQRCHVPRLEGEIRRYGAVRGQAAEGT
jgi:hypothetical protein